VGDAQQLAGDEEVVKAVSLFNVEAVQLISASFHYNYKELLREAEGDQEKDKLRNVFVLQYPLRMAGFSCGPISVYHRRGVCQSLCDPHHASRLPSNIYSPQRRTLSTPNLVKCCIPPAANDS